MINRQGYLLIDVSFVFLSHSWFSAFTPLLSFLDPVSKSVELQWASQPDVDDEWSGASKCFSNPPHTPHPPKQLLLVQKERDCIKEFSVSNSVLLNQIFQMGRQQRTPALTGMPPQSTGETMKSLLYW